MRRVFGLAMVLAVGVWLVPSMATATKPPWQKPSIAIVGCQIDANSAGITIPEGVSTSSVLDSEAKLKCAAQNTNLQLRCQGRFEGWSGKAQIMRGFECLITDQLCPPGPAPAVLETFPADFSELHINRKGWASLFCKTKPY